MIGPAFIRSIEAIFPMNSFDLAVSTVYRKGKLRVSADKNAGTPLPRNYHAIAERIATRARAKRSAPARIAQAAM